jgi:hypothetical protein
VVLVVLLGGVWVWLVVLVTSVSVVETLVVNNSISIGGGGGGGGYNSAPEIRCDKFHQLYFHVQSFQTPSQWTH